MFNLQFVATIAEGAWKQKEEAKAAGSLRGLRLQDKELQEMGDEGMCLSMHQPWASLLIAGIKLYIFF